MHRLQEDSKGNFRMVLDGRHRQTDNHKDTKKSVTENNPCDPCDDCSHWAGKI